MGDSLRGREMSAGQRVWHVRERPLNNAAQVKIDLRGFFQKNSDKWEIMCYNINDNLF